MMRQPTAREWAIIGKAFARIGGLSGEAQRARLDRARLDPFIKDQVRLLIAASQHQGILDRPLRPSEIALDHGYASLQPGTVIGRFRVERLIGRGGAGEVYLAERTEGGFVQRVALKMLRPEAVERGALFDAERAALATLEHPGIARIIDGGTAYDGRAYMVLEYVEGDSITTWCAAHDAALAIRLGLFLDVCDAVAHAHARLIVHRDIKPSNILIDRASRPKLLDFGIAKIIGEAASSRTTTLTMLTPDYAAPEQMNNGATTVATDVYSLGAVLFELLAGSPPWRVGNARLPSLLQRVLAKEPPIPSRTAAISSNAPVASKLIAGDLDAIILKAMRHDSGQRYSDVGELARDVRRYIAREPVAARAGSTGYYVRRFIRRYRWLVAGTSAALTLMLVAAAGIAWQARETAIERDAARAEASRLEAVNQAMLLMFGDASDSAQLQSVSVREMIDGTTQRLIRTLSPETSDAAPTIAALADLYLIIESNADAKALITASLARGVGRNDPVNAARLKLKLCVILAAEGESAEARKLLQDTNALWNTDPVRFRRERVEAIGAEALLLRQEGRRDQAIAVLTANMADAEQVYAAYDRDLSTRYSNLAMLLAEAGRLTEASDLLSRGRQHLVQTGRPPSSASLNLLRLQADIATWQGRLATAEAMFRDTIAARARFHGSSIALAVDDLHYGRLLNQTGRPAQALAFLDKAAPIAAEQFGEQSQPSVQIKIARVEALAVLGRKSEAAATFERVPAGAQYITRPGLTKARYLRSRASLALALGQEGKAVADLSDAIVAAGADHGGAFFRQESAILLRRLGRNGNRHPSTG